jgi:hypothetical protein
MKDLMRASLLALIVSSGSAAAQTPPPGPTPPAQATAPASAPPGDKTTFSKSCTAQADAKGLHGKARKAFRSECKKGVAQ